MASDWDTYGAGATIESLYALVAAHSASSIGGIPAGGSTTSLAPSAWPSLYYSSVIELLNTTLANPFFSDTGNVVEIGVGFGYLRDAICSQSSITVGRSYKGYVGLDHYSAPHDSEHFNTEVQLLMQGDTVDMSYSGDPFLALQDLVTNTTNVNGVGCSYFLGDSLYTPYGDDHVGTACFVFVDGTHSSEGVRQDLDTAWRLIYFGGMVCGDDYDGYHSAGVRAAVADWAASLSANWGTSVSLTETAPGYHLYYAVKPTP
jgi:hypothetical protein